MKVLLVGHFENKWSTNIEMERIFKKYGDKVTRFDYRQKANNNIKTYEKNFVFYLLNKFLSLSRNFFILEKIFGSFYYKILGRSYMMLSLSRLLKKKFDLVLFLKTDTIDPSLVKKFSKKFTTWYFFMDPPSVAKKINAYRYAKYATFSSATFPCLHKEFKRYNTNSYHLRQGYDSKIFNKIKDSKKNIDLLFIGTKDKNRAQKIKFLNYFFDVVCYGEGWDNKPIYRNKLNKIFNKSRVVINFNRKGDGFSVKLSQILGSGAFVITEYCDDLKKLFKKNKNLVWFSDIHELKNICQIYLNNKKLRNKIASNSYLFAKKNLIWEKTILTIKQKINA